MDAFSFKTGSAKIKFGRGAFAALPEVIAEIGGTRALIVATKFQTSLADKALGILGDTAVGVFSNATMHTPVHVTEQAVAYCSSVKADCIVSVGGGSTTGLGKAISYRNGLPNIVVPTTYAGSEVTPILGQTENGLKTTLADSRVLPAVVVYDPDLTATLPQKTSIVSGLNAMAHAAEALYAKDRNPVSSMLAVDGLGAMKRGLEAIAKDPESEDGRDNALYGAWLCGTVLGQVGMALHHKICHTLGGSFNMPHAETHAVMLPYTVGYNAHSVPELLAPIGALFDDTPAAGLYSFAKKIGSPTSLRALGFVEKDLDRAAEIAAGNPYCNPRPIDQTALRSMLQSAFDGTGPQ